MRLKDDSQQRLGKTDLECCDGTFPLGYVPCGCGEEYNHMISSSHFGPSNVARSSYVWTRSCGEFQCKKGYSRKADAGASCPTWGCTDFYCCEPPICTQYECPAGMWLKDDSWKKHGESANECCQGVRRSGSSSSSSPGGLSGSSHSSKETSRRDVGVPDWKTGGSGRYPPKFRAPGPELLIANTLPPATDSPLHQWFQRIARSTAEPLHVQSGWSYVDKNSYEDLVHGVVASMSPPPRVNSTVFEFGCGVGASLAFLRDWLHVGQVGGVDFAENAVTQVKHQFPEFASSFLVGDMAMPRLPVADDSYDHVISIGALAMYLKRDGMTHAMSEAVRILKPGGSLAFSMFLEPNGTYVGTIVERIAKDELLRILEKMPLTNVHTQQMMHPSQRDRYFVTATKSLTSTHTADKARLPTTQAQVKLPEVEQDLLAQHSKQSLAPSAVTRLDGCTSLLLEHLRHFFDEAGVSYSLGAGTLLGALRDGRRLPWDDDVDVRIAPWDWDKLTAHAASGNSSYVWWNVGKGWMNQTEESGWNNKTNASKWWFSASLVCDKGGPSGSRKAAKGDLANGNGTWVSADVVRADAGFLYQAKWVDMSAAFKQPLHRAMYEGLSMPVPELALAERYLVEEYGTDWRTPPTDRSNLSSAYPDTRPVHTSWSFPE